MLDPGFTDEKMSISSAGNELMIYILNDAMNIISHVEASLSNLTQVKAIHKLHCTLLQDCREGGAKCSGQFRAKSLRFPINLSYWEDF